MVLGYQKKLVPQIFSWIKTGKCDNCGVGEFEFINTDDCGILVNVESKGRVKIENFWIPSKVCDNPLCEWSKIKDDIKFLNRVNVNEAWELVKNE